MEQIIYLGENGFRRSSKDQFIEFLNIVNSNLGKKHIDIKKALAKSNAYSLTKNVKDMDRVFNLFKRLGFIYKDKKTYELTNLGLKLINEEDTLANTKFGFGGFEFLISLINYSESQKISILEKFIERIDYKQQNFTNLFLDINRKQYTLDTKINSKKDFCNFIYKYTNSKTDKQIQNMKIRKSFWNAYFKLAEISSHDQDANQQKEDFYNIVKIYKEHSGGRSIFKRNDFWFKLIGIDNFLLRKRLLKRSNTDKYFNRENFKWVYNVKEIRKQAIEYKLYASLSDNLDITCRMLSLFSGFQFAKSKVNNKFDYFIKLNDDHKSFLDALKKDYQKTKNIIIANNCISFKDLCNKIKIKPFISQKPKIEDFIKKCGISNINLILSSFEKGTSLKIKNKIDSVFDSVFNSDLATLPTWFEYFTTLKIISTSDYKLDEKIWNGKIAPNFIPISFAAGGKPDIEFNHKGKKLICEVTLTKGDNQEKQESNSVKRHIVHSNATKAIFMAPKINPNAKAAMSVPYQDEKTDKIYEINDKIIFITPQKLANINKIEEIYKI